MCNTINKIENVIIVVAVIFMIVSPVWMILEKASTIQHTRYNFLVLEKGNGTLIGHSVEVKVDRTSFDTTRVGDEVEIFCIETWTDLEVEKFINITDLLKGEYGDN